jgi:hypothetical protein
VKLSVLVCLFDDNYDCATILPTKVILTYLIIVLNYFSEVSLKSQTKTDFTQKLLEISDSYFG